MNQVLGNQLDGETSILDLGIGLLHLRIGPCNIDEEFENGRHHQQADCHRHHQLNQAEP
ncbi:hypothetical protein D3C84_988390 [compost metagenome]